MLDKQSSIFKKSRLFAKNWLHQHPTIYAFYKGNKLRILSSWFRNYPDFIVIGAQKSGTTALYDFLTKHPCIIPASTKEIDYFSSFYKFGNCWYRSNFPTKIHSHLLKIKLKKKILTGEATPSYLLHSEAPKRIKKLLPNVKLILILRNPVDRAYSHYNYEIQRKNEILSFEDALKAEKERLEQDEIKTIEHPIYDSFHFKFHLRFHSYCYRGIYVDQLKNWFRYFNRNQILILENEEFKRNPKKILKNTFEFLNMANFEIDTKKKLNVGKYEKMDPKTRKYLINFYKQHNENLFKLLGIFFNWNS